MWNNCKKITKNGVEFLTFDRLSDLEYIKHGFSTKVGGVSKGEFATMNLSFSRGDDMDAVHTNYERFFKAIGCTLSNIVMSDQIHEATVQVIKQEDVEALGSELALRKLNQRDGMVTNVKQVPLATYYADCVPLYFVDTKRRAIGLSHSGWRGTALGIGLETIRTMTREYGTNPQDVIAVIGPSICKSCYEVSQEVIDKMQESFGDKFALTGTYSVKGNGKYQMDLWEMNRRILLFAGLLPQNIVISEICTSCNSDWLFSHRVTNGKRGNLAAVLELVK